MAKGQTFKQKWPEATRDALTVAMVDGGMSATQAWEAATAGQLPGVPADGVPPLRTVAGYGTDERRRRRAEALESDPSTARGGLELVAGMAEQALLRRARGEQKRKGGGDPAVWAAISKAGRDLAGFRRELEKDAGRTPGPGAASNGGGFLSGLESDT